MPLSRPGRP